MRRANLGSPGRTRERHERLSARGFVVADECGQLRRIGLAGLPRFVAAIDEVDEPADLRVERGQSLM